MARLNVPTGNGLSFELIAFSVSFSTRTLMPTLALQAPKSLGMNAERHVGGHAEAEEAERVVVRSPSL